jgi:DNA polymerase-3 subunit beta
MFISEQEEIIRTLYTEDTVDAAFYGDYVRDFLTALGDEGDVRLQFKDAESALEISTEGESNGYSWRYLCMPMRISPPSWPLPTDFTTSVSARVIQSLIAGYNFDELSCHGSSLFVFTGSALTVVIRDGQRLYSRESELVSGEGKNDEQRILVPHEIMIEIQQLLAESDVQNVEFAENGGGVRCRIGDRSHAWLKVLQDRREDAVMPPSEFTIALSTQSLKPIIDSTIFVISKEESRYSPNGALLVLNSNTFAMVATDGHRMAFAKKTHDFVGGVVEEKRILIERDVLHEIRQLLSDSQPLKVELAENECAYCCRIGERIFSWAKPASGHKFPDYEPFLLEQRAKMAVVQVDELREAILQVCGPSGSDQLQYFAMNIGHDELKISTESRAGSRAGGKRERSICVRSSEEPMELSLSTPYTLDFLDALGDVHSVRLAFKDARSAVEICPEDAARDIVWRYLVMPRRISQ